MEYTGRNYILKNSRKIVHANRGIIGICPDLDMFSGYDDQVLEGCYRNKDLQHIEFFTNEERKEIALEMIKRWIDWAGSSATFPVPQVVDFCVERQIEGPRMLKRHLAHEWFYRYFKERVAFDAERQS